MPIQPKQQPPYYITETPVKTYIAILNQSGTDAPLATVLQNTLGGTLIWTRADIGLYRGTLTNAFTLNKTTCFTETLQAIDTPNAITIYPETVNNIAVITGNFLTQTTDDGILNGTPIEIKIYP